MSKVRWGVLSTSRFARNKVIPAIRECSWAEVTAIASRTLENARGVALELGIDKVYGSYAELLADPEIDAIYNPTPNHLHVADSKLAQILEARRHGVSPRTPAQIKTHQAGKPGIFSGMLGEKLSVAANQFRSGKSFFNGDAHVLLSLVSHYFPIAFRFQISHGRS